MRFSRIIVGCLLFFVATTCVSALSREEVYYGDRRRYRKPAAVKAKKVFMAIPAYKEIVEKDIEEDSALYLKKLAEANKIFLDVLKEFAEDNGYDLICEEGALDDATVVTDDVVEAVKKKTEQ